MTEQALSARTGLYFEEFEAGQSITSPGRTITETDVVNFAALSGDWNAMHTDAEYAAKHPFGQRVAHGLLGLSIAREYAQAHGGNVSVVKYHRHGACLQAVLPLERPE